MTVIYSVHDTEGDRMCGSNRHVVRRNHDATGGCGSIRTDVLASKEETEAQASASPVTESGAGVRVGVIGRG